MPDTWQVSEHGRLCMKKKILAVLFGMVAAAGVAVALATGEAEAPADGPDTAAMVVLGEEDLADRAEILRNMYRRITPPDMPLVQDVGTWPAAWEEFGVNWDAAAADREYGAWVVPVEVSQDAGVTVVKDGAGAVLWRGWTDFARPESADVVLTGGLVAEEDWAAYEGVRDAVAAMRETAGGTPAPPERTGTTNGLRFTAHAWTTNDTFRLELAYEIDTNVDIFAYAVACTSSLVVATWTNDENQVITDTNTVWTSVGLPFNGMESDWEQRGTVAISNGVAEFEDSGFSEELSRLRFYAAAVAQDLDGDGLNDGVEVFVKHTNPSNPDSDGDGVLDGMDTFPNTSNVWWVVTTSNAWYYREYLGDCPLNTPRHTNRFWDVIGAAPTSDSVLSNVCVSGHVDDIISVDGLDVDSDPGPTNYTNRSILNLIYSPTSHVFRLQLHDWPDPNHEGPNEVRLGNTDADPFVVEWTWLVPMSMTGPNYMCVGDTAQLLATGAGGGPYTWSVSTDPPNTVAEIDEDGMLSALAPGIATVMAEAAGGFAVSQTVTMVQIDFLDLTDTPASALKIGKWTNAFRSTITTSTEVTTNVPPTTNVTVVTNYFLKDNFIDLDADRFKVRVIDTSVAGDGILPISLSTVCEDPDLEDNPTGLTLYETPENSGVFISTNLLLVADDIDDAYSDAYIPQDDILDDRTHKIGLGGKVRVQYPPNEGTWTEKEIPVAKDKTVHIIPIFLHDATLASSNYVVLSKEKISNFLRISSRRYAQMGICLEWDEPVICEPPGGVDLFDGLTLRPTYTTNTLAQEAKIAIECVGTTNTLDDIHLIIANHLWAGEREIRGMAVAGYGFDKPSDTNYLYNIFLNASQYDEESGGAVAHELGHLLTNTGHVSDGWRVMYRSARYGVTGTRRFVEGEETTIKDNTHVQ